MQTYKTLVNEYIAESKPDAYHSLFQHELINVKEEHGLDGHNSGEFTYAEGMTRKAARKIARNRARKRLKEIMVDLDEQNYQIEQGALNNVNMENFNETRSSQATA